MCCNKALWLVKRSHLILNIQSEWLISAWQSYATLKLVDDISSWSIARLKPNYLRSLWQMREISISVYLFQTILILLYYKLVYDII